MKTSVIQVYPSGRLVDLFDLRPDDFVIEDIACSLAQINRFGGHTLFPYSVAAHCIAALKLMARGGFSPKAQLCALLHDVEEAFFGDIANPVKSMLPHDMKQIMVDARHTGMHALGGFIPPEGLPFTLDRIGEVDKFLLFAERNRLQPRVPRPAPWIGENDRPAGWIFKACYLKPRETFSDLPEGVAINPKPWREVADEFLELHDLLSGRNGP